MALMKPGDTFMGLDLACRRPPHPRLARQHVGQVVQRRELQRAPRRPAHRHGPGRARSPASIRPKVIVAGGSAYSRHLGLRPLPRDRDDGRRLLHGRHRPFRRARRRRRASLAVPARPCRHHHDAQDPARPARRHDPDQRRGAREEDQLGDLPRPPGRAADARHRGEGGRLRRGAAAGVQALRPRRRRERQGARRHDRGPAASTSSPAAPTTT